MAKTLKYLLYFLVVLSCQKNGNSNLGSTSGSNSFSFNSISVNGFYSTSSFRGISTQPVIRISFTAPLSQSTVSGAVVLSDSKSKQVPVAFAYQNQDSTLLIRPSSPLSYISGYQLTVSSELKSKAGGGLLSAVSIGLYTAIDSSGKFAVIPNDSLLTIVQRQTFKYFWNFGHPISGMARERNSSGDIVTTGGTGFGILSIPVAVERRFISREDGVQRIQTILNFLSQKASHFHGAFSHWMNGADGTVVPFGTNDNGADIVETSYLIMGLLAARQYFDGSLSDEKKMRDDINTLWDNVDWNWFRKNDSNMLFWNWSPDYGWAVNVPVRGWNECLITYVLAASSNTHSIPKIVYDEGFAKNGAIKNGNAYFGIELPLGQPFGGPLFFEQYSFLGINPTGLTDAYADYWKQAVNHTKINLEYCKANPKNYFGYSSVCWGLTASDIQNGYTASSPTNDVGVIAPTAAISSFPYTPVESLNALRFYYYQMGDKIWGSYGFTDAFDLTDIWFADSYLAIDQGPQIVMIENYRSALLWNLFMSCPEVKTGMKKLGFQSPNL